MKNINVLEVIEMFLRGIGLIILSGHLLGILWFWGTFEYYLILQTIALSVMILPFSILHRFKKTVILILVVGTISIVFESIDIINGVIEYSPNEIKFITFGITYYFFVRFLAREYRGQP